MPAPKPAFQRILLKLSGESLLGKQAYGIDVATARAIAQEIKEVHDLGVEIAVMIGGGNIVRGARSTAEGFERVAADQMGLLATVMNGIALQDVLEKEGVVTRHMSAVEIKAVAEPFIRRRAIRHLEKGRIVIFTAGLGSPYFTTDLKVMDATAISLCKDNDLPIIVFNLRKRGNIKRAVLGEGIGTRVY